MRLLLCLLIVLALGCADEPPASDDVPADSLAVELPDLRDELRAMYESDQAVRAPIMEAGMDFANVPPEALAKMRAVDSTNRVRLREIIAEHGWPTAAMVGPEGLEATFYIIQHNGLDFQQEALPYVRQWYEAGAIPGQEVALMTDRVLLGEGEGQRYGTQFDVSDGVITVHPIADSARVDERRAALGLPPMDVFLDAVQAMIDEAESSQ